ncbi:hypothetical protein FWF48_00655 [Candidatus Saccharibacteria bacterium]|nr:hypothetical protein [Candidatus Saccharibacteria bacterium]
MKIGVDIDNVMTDSSELIIQYAKKYFKSNDMDLIDNILHANKVDERLMAFYEKYLTKMQGDYKLKANVKEVIDSLRQKGHEIVLITARGNSQTHSYLDKLGQDIVTKEYLLKHKINFDKIIFGTRDKAKECVENHLDILVDDSTRVLGNLHGTNTKPILFVSMHNKNCQTSFVKVYNWLELEEIIDREQLTSSG